jgi:hypothetical protein
MAPPQPTTGTVTDADGNPVSDAYVIGMTALSVARTDAAGHYSMPCTAQKLVAATWLLPVMTAGTTSINYGKNTTEYGPPPVAPGAGYKIFSGGVSEVSQASPVACDGNPVNFQLPAGATVDITWTTGSGPVDGSESTSTTTDTPPSSSIDDLYLPGLADQAARETAPISGGHQIIPQLAQGIIRIDATGTAFTCSGPGVAGYGSTWYVTVPAAAITSVTCTTSAPSS